MKRHIVIVVPQAPNFELLAFKYFLLSLNTKLSTLEFSFSDIGPYVFEDEKLEFNGAISRFREAVHMPKGDFIICIVSFSFTDNHFTHSSGKLSMITTDVWEKAFSPPSLFEYLVHNIISEMLIMDTALDLYSDEETRGCVLDLCQYKEHARVGILCGFMSERVKIKLIEAHGEEY